MVWSAPLWKVSVSVAVTVFTSSLKVDEPLMTCPAPFRLTMLEPALNVPLLVQFPPTVMVESPSVPLVASRVPPLMVRKSVSVVS